MIIKKTSLYWLQRFKPGSVFIYYTGIKYKVTDYPNFTGVKNIFTVRLKNLDRNCISIYNLYPFSKIEKNKFLFIKDDSKKENKEMVR